MAIVDFLRRNHEVTAVFINHGTETSRIAEEFLRNYLPTIEVPLLVFNIEQRVDKTLSQEEFWRMERYKVFYRLEDAPIITCHHLDDCVETWIWSSMHGNGKIIPYRHANVIRPFRLSRKADFIKWCTNKSVEWVEDKSNVDVKHIRNYIRHVMMPNVLTVNPGIHKVIIKKVKNETPDYDHCSDGSFDNFLGSSDYQLSC